MKLLLILPVLIGLASASSPTHQYSPGQVACPNKQSLTREADSISEEEKIWLSGREPIAMANLISFLENAGLQDFDAQSFVKNASKSITIGISFSGGGYRAMLTGAGQLAALDSRVNGANEHGLGGLLQASTYITGLSGGSWLVGTVALNNFLSVDSIIPSDLWNLSSSLIFPGGNSILKNIEDYHTINNDLQAKKDAGYTLSITDIWGRILSYQMFTNAPNKGSAQTWSDIQIQSEFATFQVPFPIIVTDGRTPGSTVVDSNSTIIEMSPFELGSWDPSLYGFTDITYLGTKVNNGVPVNGQCIAGFDNSGFAIGTSSSLFNEVVIEVEQVSSIGGLMQDLIDDALNGFESLNVDIADYAPNPFFGFSGAESTSISLSNTLYLSDGGEDGQNVPIAPLIEPKRKVDVIFAYDSSNDTPEVWPDGSALIATYNRQFSHQGNGTHFPYVPDKNSFLNLNLTNKPAFFGCNASALSALVEDSSESVFDVPLVVYTANRPFSFMSNTSTYKIEYTLAERQGMITNGFEVASRMNSTLDLEWAACVGCAIIRREQERQGLDQLEQCKGCFQRYCWNGEVDDATPAELYY